MPRPTEDDKERMRQLHRGDAVGLGDLDVQVEEILARPGARTSMGMLNPRVVSREEARLIAQQEAFQPQQKTRFQKMEPRLMEAIGELTLATPATFAQLIPGGFDFAKQFQGLQEQYGPIEAWKRWGEEGRPTIPSFDIPEPAFGKELRGFSDYLGIPEIPFMPKQLGLKGALEMFAQPDVIIPGLLGLGKFFRSGPALSTVARKGNLLQAATPEELGPGYQVKDALKVARDLEDQVTSTGNIIMSRLKDAKRDLGKMDNNGHMLDVPNQPSIYDVAENPTAYIGVTDRQKEGIRKLTDIVADIRKERAIFGRSPDDITLAEEGRFLPRTVLSTATVDDIGRPGGMGGGLRGGGTERSRFVGVGDVAKAEARGVVYADPIKSVSDYSQRWLQDAADTHIRDLLVPFSETSSMRVNPALREKMLDLRKQAQSLLQSTILLSDKQSAAIRAFLMSDDPDLDAFRRTISSIRITRGRFKTQTGATTARETTSPTLTQTGETAARDKLPRELAGAKPRYNMGQRVYIPQFESDLDRALFIVSQTKKSAKDESYMEWLRGQLPNLSDEELRSAGKDVRAHIKVTVSGKPDGNVIIPTSRIVREASPDPTDAGRTILTTTEEIADVERPMPKSRVTGETATRSREVLLAIDQAKKDLANIRKEAKKLAPQWRNALQESKKIPVGRARVPGDNTPMLMGRDFTEDEARRISRHYWSRGPTWNRDKVIDKILTGSRSVRFLNATFDISALLRQQASAAVAHPATYVRNVFKSFRDVVDSRTYDELLASPEGQRAASRGVAIFGGVGEVAEFQATSWLDWIPVTKQFNNHFIRFNTRQRVDLFDLERKRLIAKFGRATTPAEEDAIANAINRATGVSKSRPGEFFGRGKGSWGEFENQALFASRYTRSTIEEVVRAASDRSIEGEIARRYIGQLVAVTASLATAAAVAQKRDPSEVLNPFDMRAMDKGRLSLNPNFLSVRLFGHDVKPLGPFDSLARLMFVATDAVHQAWTTREYKKLGDFIVYGAGTKGSPLVSFGLDLVRGTTFTGEETIAPPRSLSDLGTAGRVLPFTLQTISEDVSRGMPTRDVLGGAALESVGEKTSTMSFSDYTDEFAREQFGARYRDLEPFQRDIIRDNIEAAIEEGRIPRRQASDPYWEDLDNLNKELDAKMNTLVDLVGRVDKGTIIRGYFNAISENRISKDQAAISHNMDEFEADPNETDPNKLALQGYYDLFDRAEVRTDKEVKGVFISEVFDRLRSEYERGLTAEQLQYVYRNTNMRDIPIEILKQLPASTRNRVLNSMRARRAMGQRQEEQALEIGGIR